ncbi:MAG: hypothetical protein Q4E05_07660 [Pseudoclavibacter sp.]|nr:hypothetical protein [Pseudoclavibacter sp.]
MEQRRNEIREQEHRREQLVRELRGDRSKMSRILLAGTSIGLASALLGTTRLWFYQQKNQNPSPEKFLTTISSEFYLSTFIAILVTSLAFSFTPIGDHSRVNQTAKELGKTLSMNITIASLGVSLTANYLIGFLPEITKAPEEVNLAEAFFSMIFTALLVASALHDRRSIAEQAEGIINKKSFTTRRQEEDEDRIIRSQLWGEDIPSIEDAHTNGRTPPDPAIRRRFVAFKVNLIAGIFLVLPWVIDAMLTPYGILIHPVNLILTSGALLFLLFVPFFRLNIQSSIPIRPSNSALKFIWILLNLYTWAMFAAALNLMLLTKSLFASYLPVQSWISAVACALFTIIASLAFTTPRLRRPWSWFRLPVQHLEVILYRHEMQQRDEEWAKLCELEEIQHQIQKDSQ